MSNFSRLIHEAGSNGVNDLKFLNSSVRFDDAVQFCRSFFSPALLRGTWAVSPMGSRRADLLLCVNSRHCHEGIITGISGGFGRDLGARSAPSASLEANIRQSHQSGDRRAGHVKTW